MQIFYEEAAGLEQQIKNDKTLPLG